MAEKNDFLVKTKQETENVQLWKERQIYTGQKEIVKEEEKYRYVKIGERVKWTQTGFTTAQRTPNDDIKVLETRYTVTKEVDAQGTTCTNFQLDNNWYASVPSNTSTKRYNSNPINSKTELLLRFDSL